MPVMLNDAECDVLCWVLNKYLPELRYEAARIKLPRDRHDLVANEVRLTMLLERLSERPASQVVLQTPP
jgi:hypothetical protein